MALSASLLVLTLLAAGAAPAAAPEKAPAGNPHVVFHTTKGDITIELYKDKAPISTENFLSYVRSGHYDGTVFHRVIPKFMIQGGGFSADMQQKKTQAPIQNEAKNGLKNRRGTLSMARTSDPNSATSQFFINLVDNASLDQPEGGGWGYAVFGEVTSGMEVVDAIATVQTGNRGPYQNVPNEAIIITKAEIKP